MNIVDHWGEHLSIDLRACNDLVKDKNVILEFGEKLIKQINMEKWDDFKNPLCVHFGKDDKAGYTYSCLITTSNICAHFCDISKNAYLDIFSCRTIDINIVRNLIFETFNPVEWRHRFDIRGDW